MSANDCFQMGAEAYAKADYINSAQWMEESYIRLSDADLKTEFYIDVLEYLSYTNYKNGN